MQFKNSKLNAFVLLLPASLGFVILFLRLIFAISVEKYVRFGQPLAFWSHWFLNAYQERGQSNVLLAQFNVLSLVVVSVSQTGFCKE